MSRKHPLPMIAVAPPLPVAPVVADATINQTATSFPITAAVLLGALNPKVSTEAVDALRADYAVWLGDRKSTRRKAREYLRQKAQ